MKRVAVIGTGYVGLTSGACFAHLGHQVTCADISEERVERLQRGDVPILEAGLDELVREGIDGGRLRFTTDNAEAVADAEFIYLCVPTPQGEDGSADLSYIEAAAASISAALEADSVVVNKSTVPVGSTRVVERALGRSDVFVVSNPEFLREGTAVHDFLHPDRVVVGSDEQAAAHRVAELYESIQAPVIVTDAATSETIKYASNAFLATKISFVNSLAAVCEQVGADVRDVVLGMGYDKRIGFEFLKPGPGWGGSCFPKDTRALVHIADTAGYDFSLLRGVVDVNEAQFERVADKAARLVGGSLDGAKVAAWGLTFKARTDDLRDSPSLEVLRRVIGRGASVTAYDPAVGSDLDGIRVVGSALEAVAGADLLLVLTEWDEFRWVDFAEVAAAMSTPNMVDARNLLDPVAMRKLGFTYDAIGRR